MLLCMLILHGCSSNIKGNNSEIEENANFGYPFEVEDYLGRKITISKPVKNIACGYAFTGHAVALFGRGEDIVAVVGGLQRDKILTTMYPHIKDLPVPFSSGAINIEELLMCKPDIAFIRGETALNESEVSKLDKFNIPYVVVEFNSMEEQMKSILLIGKILGNEEKAEEYIKYYKDVIQGTQETALTIPESEKVTLFHSVNEAVRTGHTESLPVDWIRITGAINVSEGQELKIQGDSSYATLEQIYIWDPDFIIANEVGVPEYILTNEQWKGLRAVKNKKVFQIPNGISRWGHHGSIETPLAILWTSKLLYPQYFTKIDMVQETREYYRSFFNLSLSDEEINDILTGKGMRVPKGEQENGSLIP